MDLRKLREVLGSCDLSGDQRLGSKELEEEAGEQQDIADAATVIIGSYLSTNERERI